MKITTTQLQSMLVTQGQREQGDPGGAHANRAAPIGLTDNITLDRQITIYSNTELFGDVQPRTITWLGTAPPILWGSFNADQQTFNCGLRNLTIYAPNASSIWGWAASASGNALNYSFSDLVLTCAGTHLNFVAPGDGLFYSPQVRNVKCNGTGKTMTGNPVTGVAVNLQHVNQTVSGKMIDLTFDRGSITFIGPWIEPRSAGVLGISGSFGTVTWIGSHGEPHTAGDMVSMTGPNLLTADYLGGAGPNNTVRVQDRSTLQFMGVPSYTLDGGTLPDGWPVTDPLDADLGLTYKIDATSVMRFTGGSGKLTGTI
jgi:hypothetical protein